MPATIVGRTSGRSMIESIADRPGKSSRTSTQAIRVPITQLISVVTAAMPIVRTNADLASGELM